MQNGDITRASCACRTASWFIFKLTDKQLQNENLTLDNPTVRKDITDGLVGQRRQILTEALLRWL